MTERFRLTSLRNYVWAINWNCAVPSAATRVWEAEMGGPLLLVAGGSGIMPLMAMIRHRAMVGSYVATRLLYSSRAYDEIIYHDELDYPVMSSTTLEVVHTLTRGQPPGWTGFAHCIDAQMLREVTWLVEQHPLAYICGPTPFVETAAASFVALGHEPARIKTERFGPAGETEWKANWMATRPRACCKRSSPLT